MKTTGTAVATAAHKFAARTGGALAWLALSHFAFAVTLSPSAYRALGQQDLFQNGANIVNAGTLFGPTSAAVDAQGHLYIADTQNNRVLAWPNAVSFQNGAAAQLVLGQPGPQNSIPLGIGTNGFWFPTSVAVDPTTGNLYVADLNNHRVLRFPAPFNNLTRVQPDAVYGQPNFTTRTPNSSGITAGSLNSPRGVACDSAGNLWVADTGNNRLLRYPASTLNAAMPAADMVLGQKDFKSAAPNQAQPVSASSLASPEGMAFDSKGNLYVADYGNARVLAFSAPLGTDAPATNVFGQPDLKSNGIPATPTSSSLAGPTGLAADGNGNLYIAVAADNRILIFSTAAKPGDPAKDVLGQPNLTTVTPNTGAFPRAAAASVSSPTGVTFDSSGDVMVTDFGNNRVLAFPPGSKSASRVLGQADFTGNGPNQIKPASVNAASKIAIDYSQSPYALYLSDTNNNRVLVWKDASHFLTGDPANLVIGQPDLLTAIANVDSGGAGTPTATSLSAPKGLAVASDGGLYVADSGNNRVLHYPRPVTQAGRITPDSVLGQTDLTSALFASVSQSSLHSPAGVALGPNGDIFVSDSGNNRVLEFPAGAATGASATRVYGQPGFTQSAASNTPSAQAVSAPRGLAVDSAGNLYVADSGFQRVLIFPNTQSAPPTGLAASIVLGQAAFNTGNRGAGAAGLNTPLDVSLDSSGEIWVADSGNNRAVMYPPILTLAPAGAQATFAVGQPSLASGVANYNASGGLASPESLFNPSGVYIDRQDTLYVCDSGNNRAVQYLRPVALVNGAHFQASVPVGQGAWTSLFGPGLASSTQLANTSTLQTSLAHRQVMVNDQLAAPLYYVSSGQINLIFPTAAPIGTQRVSVRVAETGELLAGGPVVVAKYSPGFFTASSSGSGPARALNQDNTINSSTNPAPYGTVVQLFGTGEGPVASPVPDGVPAPRALDKTVAAPTSDGPTCLDATKPAVCVALGGSGGGAVLGEIQYSGLAPGLIGVWQLNVLIPAQGLLGNSVTIHAVVGGAYLSNVVTVAVK